MSRTVSGKDGSGVWETTATSRAISRRLIEARSWSLTVTCPEAIETLR